jgi:hypothetical protein
MDPKINIYYTKPQWEPKPGFSGNSFKENREDYSLTQKITLKIIPFDEHKIIPRLDSSQTPK